MWTRFCSCHASSTDQCCRTCIPDASQLKLSKCLKKFCKNAQKMLTIKQKSNNCSSTYLSTWQWLKVFSTCGRPAAAHTSLVSSAQCAGAWCRQSPPLYAAPIAAARPAWDPGPMGGKTCAKDHLQWKNKSRKRFGGFRCSGVRCPDAPSLSNRCFLSSAHLANLHVFLFFSGALNPKMHCCTYTSRDFLQCFHLISLLQNGSNVAR